MDALTNTLMQTENLYLMAGVFALLETLSRILPENISKHPLYIRMTPVFPVILCSGGVWLPGLGIPGMHASERILFGLILGYAVGHTYKMAMQSIFGKDSRLSKAIIVRNVAKVDASAKDIPYDDSKGGIA